MRTIRVIRGSILFYFFFFLVTASPSFAQTVTRVDVTADSTILVAGQRITAVARAKDADGAIIPSVSLTWSSGTPSVATVDSSGGVTALFPGTVQIRARSPNNITGTLTFTVVPLKVDVSGSSAVRLNATMTLTARALDINGNSIPNVTFAWASDTVTVATVTSRGVVQGVGLGEAVISATVSGFAGRLNVTVRRPVDYSIQSVIASDATQGAESRIQSIISVSNINSRGDISFVANLSGSTAAVLFENQGQLRLLGRTGDPAPLGGVFSSFGSPAVNNRGEVVFLANVNNGIGPLLLLARGSELIVLLASGDTLEVGGTIGAITLAPDGLDDNGYATVTLTLSNPPHSGVFRISPEQSVEPLVRTFDELSIGTPTAFNQVSVAPNGRTAVMLTAGTRRGIYLVSASGSEPVVTSGAATPDGRSFATFQAVRAAGTDVYFMGTVQGASTSLYRFSGGTIEEIVRGGRDASTNRTTTITTLFSVNGASALFSATVSDIGTGIFLWNAGSFRPIALRSATMPDGEVLSRLDAAAINDSQEIALMALTDRHLSALYRIREHENSLRWATGSRTTIRANFHIVNSPTLRPGSNVTYFLAGTPAGLFKSSSGVITPIAIPGMLNPRGDAFTGIVTATSNANGDLVFIASSTNLRTAALSTLMYRYFNDTLTEWFPFNQATTFPGLGNQTISTGGLSTIGLNINRQAAFAATVSGRRSLFLAGTEFSVLLQSGTNSPAGGTFSNFSNVQVTPGGAVAFTATTTGPGGVFLYANGSVTALATTSNFSAIGGPTAGGEAVYFSARRGETTGLWVYSNGAVRAVISNGAALPTNTALTAVTAYSAQEDGSVAFQGTSAFTGVFVRRADGTMATVALLTETTPVSGRYSTFISITFANSTVLLNSFLTQDRAALFRASPEGSQSTPVTSTDFSVQNRAAVSMRTGGLPGAHIVGWASIQPGTGSTSPSGLAIFSFRQDNILVSEATVPAVALVQAGRIYAEVNGPTNTGIAIANPGTAAATISFYFTNASGGNFGANTYILGPGTQIAAFLNESPFNGGSSISGTFTLTSSEPVAVIALRGYVNERSEFLMTTLPVAPITQPSSDSVIFPHFADGDGWTTRVVLVNPTDETISGTVQFMGQGTRTTTAQPVNVTIGGRTNTTFAYDIPGRSSTVLQTAGTAAAVQAGWVRVTPGSGTRSPSGLIIFSFKRDGRTVSEAGVPASPTATAFRLYLEASGNVDTGQIGAIQTGIAIANPSSAAVAVNFDLANLSGVSTGIVGAVTVPAQGQAALFANQISGLAGVTANQGVLRISSASAVAVMGLRGRNNERGEFLITTLQPATEAAAPASTALFMPHFVESGGYSTQFILFSGSANQSSSGSLRFFNQSGQPLSLTLR